MSGKRALGNYGEAKAQALLLQQGLHIVTTQWRCRAGEIDIVAHDGAMLIFVEVRTRRGETGMAAASITPVKQERLKQLALTYLADHGLDDDTPWRIDVIAVTLAPTGRVIATEHIPYAVEE